LIAIATALKSKSRHIRIRISMKSVATYDSVWFFTIIEISLGDSSN
jgi:hypothetical protein